jgi:hypothetical protein
MAVCTCQGNPKTPGRSPGGGESVIEDEWVDCPECGGEGHITDSVTPEFDDDGKHVANISHYHNCEFCGGEMYVSPKQAAEWKKGNEVSGGENVRTPLEILKSIEWAGSKGGSDGQVVAACPCCRGVCPTDPWRHLFLKQYVGHRDNCELEAVINDAPAQAGTHPGRQ